MSDEHTHEYGTVVIFDAEGEVSGEGQACRVCGEDHPDHPVPTADVITTDDVAVVKAEDLA